LRRGEGGERAGVYAIDRAWDWYRTRSNARRRRGAPVARKGPFTSAPLRLIWLHNRNAGSEEDA
jgi:hypothetical protein